MVNQLGGTVNRRAYIASEIISQRLNAIGTNATGAGLSWWYARIMLITGFTWSLNSCQTFMFVYALNTTTLTTDIPMSVQGSALLGGSVFIGSFIGSFIFGNLADIKGRKPMFIWTLVLSCVGSALCSLSWDLYSLLFFRTLAGIGLGGELPVICTLVQELAPNHIRGRSIVFLESFWAIGCLLSVLVAYGVAPLLGWRLTLGCCSFFGMYSLVIDYAVPESPKWLASVGRFRQALALVQAIEDQCGVASPYQNELLDVHAIVEMTQSTEPAFLVSAVQRCRILFRFPYFSRTLVLWILWTTISLSYYAIYIYLPQLIGQKGFNMNGSWATIVIIIVFQLPGYLTASYFVETVGRKMTLIVFLLGSFASSVALGYVPATQWPVMIAGSALSFFMLGSWGCLYAYTPENYPTSIRAMGSSYANGVSRIGAFLGPYLIPPMVHSWGVSLAGIMWIFGGALALLAVIVLVFGIEGKGREVDSFEVMSDPKPPPQMPQMPQIPQMPPHDKQPFGGFV